MRPNRSSGTCLGDLRREQLRRRGPSPVRVRQQIPDGGRAAGRAVPGAVAELGVPEQVVPVGMRREAGHDGLARVAAGRSRGRPSRAPCIPGSMSNTPARPCTTTALFWQELALVDQHTLRDLPQHAGSFRLWFATACRDGSPLVVVCKQYGRSERATVGMPDQRHRRGVRRSLEPARPPRHRLRRPPLLPGAAGRLQEGIASNILADRLKRLVESGLLTREDTRARPAGALQPDRTRDPTRARVRAARQLGTSPPAHQPRAARSRRAARGRRARALAGVHGRASPRAPRLRIPTAITERSRAPERGLPRCHRLLGSAPDDHSEAETDEEIPVADDELSEHARSLLARNAYLTSAPSATTAGPGPPPSTSPPTGSSTSTGCRARRRAHSRNLAAQPTVSLVVFDSTVRPYHGRALYADGTAHEVGAAELDHALRRGLSRSGRPRSVRIDDEADVTGAAPWRLYRAPATRTWVLCPREPRRPCARHDRTDDHRVLVGPEIAEIDLVRTFLR